MENRERAINPPNEEPVAVVRDGLRFVSTTPSPGKDSDDDVIYAHDAAVHL
jgi:hypothetical protein